MAKGKSNGTAKPAEVLAGMIDQQLHDDQAAEKLPLLLRILQQVTASDGKLVQQEGTLVISQDGPQWSVRITQPTFQKTVILHVSSLIGLFEQIEHVLGHGGVLWRDSWVKQKKDRQALARRLQ